MAKVQYKNNSVHKTHIQKRINTSFLLDYTVA